MAAAHAKKNAPSRELLEKIFRTAYRIRVFETEGIKLYRQGLIRGYFHPYLGQEGIATGVCAALKEGDYIASTHRGHGHCIAWGADIKRMVAELLQKETGYCRGYGGSMHIADIAAGNLGANGIVGAGTPLGVGAALANQIRGSDAVTVTFTTDGASNNGTFLESLNLAAIWNLNFILVIENNQYAVSTKIEESTREVDLYKRGLSIGVESHQIDGNDPLARLPPHRGSRREMPGGQGADPHRGQDLPSHGSSCERPRQVHAGGSARLLQGARSDRSRPQCAGRDIGRRESRDRRDRSGNRRGIRRGGRISPRTAAK